MKKRFLITLLAIGGILTSCSEDSNSDADGTAKVTVKLTDGPASYDAVRLDIRSIEFENGTKWEAIQFPNPGIFNLLDFKNGMDTVLGQIVLPAGKVGQMRMVLGDQNTIVVDGVSYPLKTPSAQQSGLKFNWNETLAADGAYTVWVDFDAGRSIVKKGNGDYSLKPVIRTFSELTDGQIKGFLKPQEANGVVHVIKATDTLATAIPNVDGFYMFRGLPEGSYTVSLDADAATSYKDQDIANVNVTFGKVTDVGTKTLTR